ncbi:hypothetical protein [Nocardia callitridis]|uniref:Uncharacterized protein n=1 Tax=Nocardia callitridis TaxID=648753 RepID=A0ABP9KY69_9NOCA
MSTPRGSQGWRVLGFGKHPEIAEAINERFREAGQAGGSIVVTDDEAGDARLIQELCATEYDGVAIGSFVSGQNPEDPPTAETTAWFNRVLNIIHSEAPMAKMILVRDPGDVLPAIGRVLGER